MPVVHEPVEQWGDHDHVTEEPRPGVDGPIGRDDRGPLLVPRHDDIGELVAGLRGEFARKEIVDEEQFDARDLRAEFPELPEFARFGDVFEELMRFAVPHRVPAPDDHSLRSV